MSHEIVLTILSADQRTLAKDEWPSGIGRVLQEGVKAVHELAPARLVPCDIHDLPNWLCLECQPNLGRAVVVFRTDVKSGEDESVVQVGVRLQGIISDMNLALGGNWDG